MIPKNIKKFCFDDPTLIENYYVALNSDEKYDCHHRLETDLGLTLKDLKEQNLYFNRPASELILLSHSEHTKLHKTGTIFSEEHVKNLSTSLIGKNKGKKRTNKQRKHMSDILKGTKMMTDGYVQCKVKPEYWGEFIDIGFYFGHISNYGKGGHSWNAGLPSHLQPTYGKKLVKNNYVSMDH